MKKEFVTVINCMDGRIQTAVHKYISDKKEKEYVDMITLAGPSKVINENKLKGVIDDLKFRLDISIKGHKSNTIAIVGHFDCAGIPEPDENQKIHVVQAVSVVQSWYPDVEVEGIWVNPDLSIEEL